MLVGTQMVEVVILDEQILIFLVEVVIAMVVLVAVVVLITVVAEVVVDILVEAGVVGPEATQMLTLVAAAAAPTTLAHPRIMNLVQTKDMERWLSL